MLQTLLCTLAVSILLGGCTKTETVGIGNKRTGTQNIATEQFVVDADKGGVITGKDGAVIAFPPGALLDEMGNTVKGPVNVYLKEARRDVDILVGGLVTMAGDQLLASDGMYMIDARAGGKTLKINPAIGIYGYFPTDKKQPDMRLYQGALDADKLDWRLTDATEKQLPFCDRDKASREKCKRCERLAKMSKKIKPGRKPKEEDYYVKRYVWENGKMYFYSSGSKKVVFSQEQLDDCADYLAASSRGAELLALVDQRKAEWKDRIGEYYEFQLKDLGWYNLDRAVKEKMMAFQGRIIDQDGQLQPGASVHMYCKDSDMRVHTAVVAEDGNFSLQFEEGRQIILFAYHNGEVGKQPLLLRQDGQSAGDIVLSQVDPESASHADFLSDLM
jgi:hypothetical protein